ncbi:hypothetical protein B9Z55_002524 [Caenorhabditis nigoni]|uniref:Uncharacterized protein n=1 Tax=Caenorhabditis nigoni TaxID=1611254 RepID=A0A2G5VKX3_9PELO|nr:hypothetical protein B9Z55_002524 [Caenorhabditis nigoni]
MSTAQKPPPSGGDLLRSLLMEPTIASQKLKDTVIQTLGIREQPSVWTRPFVSTNANYQPVPNYPIKYHYMYTDVAAIPLHHFYNPALYNGAKIDVDDYLPQCDLYWLRKTYERDLYKKKQQLKGNFE